MGGKERKWKKKNLMETQVMWKHLNVKVFMVSFCGEGLTSVWIYFCIFMTADAYTVSISKWEYFVSPFYPSSGTFLPVFLWDHFQWFHRASGTGYGDGRRRTVKLGHQTKIWHNLWLKRGMLTKNVQHAVLFLFEIITTITWTQPNGVCTIYYK